MTKMPRKQLVLKAVLLLRKVNRHSSKEEQLAMMDKYYSTEQLEDYIGFLILPNLFGSLGYFLFLGLAIISPPKNVYKKYTH